MIAGRPGPAWSIVVTIVAALAISVLVVGCAETSGQAEAEAAAPDIEAASEPMGEAPPVPPADPAASEDEEPDVMQDEPADENEDAEEEGAEPAADQEQQETDQAAEEATGNMKTVIRIKTGEGDILAELYDEKMPITAGNFLLLIDQDFYKNLKFHRVVPSFVIQGGDPKGDGSGGPDWSIPLEHPGKIHHERGILSMARARPLDSAGSQFFVCLSNNESVQALDNLGGGYAAFGKVIEGMEVADKIDVGDALKDIEIVSESEHADDARAMAKKVRIE